MIASRVLVRRWWLALLLAAVAVTAWHARPPSADSGPPSLASVLERPSWRLRITRVRSTCFGPVLWGDFTIASTGEATWTRGPGWPVRRLALSGEQLALARRLDRLAHAEPEPGDFDFFVIGPDRGALGELDVDGGAHVSPASELGRAITSILDELADRPRPLQQAAIASIELRLESTRPGTVYRVGVTGGGRFTIDRGRERLLDVSLDPGLLIDLVDALLEQRAAGLVGAMLDRLAGAPDLRGVLQVHGLSVPVALAPDGRGASGLIHRALANLGYFEYQGRSASE